MKTALAMRFLALVLSAFTTLSASAAEKFQQLRVTVSYTRDAKILRRLGPDNFERGKLHFTLNSTFEVLAQEAEPGGEPGTPEGESKWITLLPTPSVGQPTGQASLTSELTVDKPLNGQPAKTTANYSGKFTTDSIRFNGLAPAWPFTDGYEAAIEIDLPLTGTSTGVAPGLPANGGVSITDAPVTCDGDTDLRCRTEFKIFSIPGPAPSNHDAARLHQIKSLQVPMADVYASTAPKPVWVGAKTEKLPNGTWRFTYDGKITWPMGEGGETTDTLKVTIEPVKRTLPAPKYEE